MRDYDFSVVLPASNEGTFGLPEGFGDLHALFKHFLGSDAYRANFSKGPVIASASPAAGPTTAPKPSPHPGRGVPAGRVLCHRPVLRQDGPAGALLHAAGQRAPLAFYFQGDLLGDYSNLELIGTISTMEAFQKIYRPEIYNANSVAGKVYQPSLKHQDYSSTRIVYDREERSQLAVKQGRFTEEHFIKPYRAVLEQWAAR